MPVNYIELGDRLNNIGIKFMYKLPCHVLYTDDKQTIISAKLYHNEEIKKISCATLCSHNYYKKIKKMKYVLFSSKVDYCCYDTGIDILKIVDVNAGDEEQVSYLLSILDRNYNKIEYEVKIKYITFMLGYFYSINIDNYEDILSQLLYSNDIKEPCDIINQIKYYTDYATETNNIILYSNYIDNIFNHIENLDCINDYKLKYKKWLRDNLSSYDTVTKILSEFNMNMFVAFGQDDIHFFTNDNNIFGVMIVKFDRVISISAGAYIRGDSQEIEHLVEECNSNVTVLNCEDLEYKIIKIENLTSKFYMLSDLMWMTEDNNMRASDEILFKMLTFASYGTDERKKNQLDSQVDLIKMSSSSYFLDILKGDIERIMFKAYGKESVPPLIEELTTKS